MDKVEVTLCMIIVFIITFAISYQLGVDKGRTGEREHQCTRKGFAYVENQCLDVKTKD